MRDKWYFQLAVGWYKLSIAERGFISTLYSQGEEFTGETHDVDTLFEPGWVAIANGLATKKVISVEMVRFGIYKFQLLLKNAKHREYHKTYSQKKHLRTSTHIYVDSHS